MELWELLLLACGGFLGGLVDSIGGGGGLITVPLLLGTGLSPVAAIATNKAQSSCGGLSASIHYIRNGVVKLAEIRTGIGAAAVGAAAGAFCLGLVRADLLSQVIPFLLLGFAAFLLFRPQYGVQEHAPRLPRVLVYLGAGLGLGFYDGFFGPGTGTFWALALTAIAGHGLRRATGETKVLNLTSNLVSLAVFAGGGHIVWQVAAVMALGQVLGARIGAQLVVRKGSAFVRPILLTVTFAVGAKMLFDQMS